MIFLYRYDVPALASTRVHGLAAVGDRFDFRRVWLEPRPRRHRAIAGRADRLGPGGAATGRACLPAGGGTGPAWRDPFRAPAPAATELNAAAKVLYRQGKWEEARAQYRAAEAADPDFLAPRG